MRTKRIHAAVPLAAVVLSVLASLLVTAGPAQAGTDTDRSATIPATAFLQPADLDGTTMHPADADLRPALRPPQPCDPDGFRSLGTRRASGAVTAMLGVPGDPPRPTVLVEDIGLYRGAGARRYMNELRRAVNRCAGCTDAAGTWIVLDRQVAGRDSLLLRLDITVDIEGSIFVQRSYVFVARVGSAIVTLADVGWEIADGHEAIVRALAPAAVRRAATLR